MDIHIRVRRWVVWWFYVGVLCAAVVGVNLLARTMSRGLEDFVIFLGAVHWVLGGLVCFALEGVRIGKPVDDRAPITVEIGGLH